MRYLAVFALLLLIACNDDAPAAVQTGTPAVRPNDSPVVKRESANPYAPIDFSPLDISYFPADYPKLKMSKATAEPPVARVIYSRPQKQGRTIFGSLLKWGEPWRLGANEATEVEFFRSVSIQGKTIPKGRYVLYGIPEPKSWTLVLNGNLDSWGLHPDRQKDLHRFTVPSRALPVPVEHFTMVFERAPDGAELVIAWDVVETRLPIRL